jgi:hypothetical protein
MGYEYKEKRSKHALAVDRALQAKKKHGKFNEEYGNSPNRSDVDEYDTKGKYIPAPKPKGTPKPKEPPRPAETYKPTNSERNKLLRIFHSQGIMAQHKDLLTTRNVARTKKDVERWKKNPKHGDIESIDTQPKELIPARIKYTQDYVGIIPRAPVRTYKQAIKLGVPRDKLGRNSLGEFQHPRYVPAEDVTQKDTQILVRSSLLKDPSSPQTQRVVAHELGHAMDFFKIGKSKGLSKYDFGHSGEKYNNLYSAIQIERVTRGKINPYPRDLVPSSFVRYRNRQRELFANWFSGLITRKETVKKDSPIFYKKFKKENKGFISGLRKSDFAITSKYTKGLKL